MAASDKTVDAVLRVLLEYMRASKALSIARDLLEVPGNKSFRDTVQALHHRLEDICKTAEGARRGRRER
jgi:hypothetical protein